MKRLLTLATIFICPLLSTFAQFSGSGSGTENDPYLIMNPIQLNQLRNFLNVEGVYFKLMANVNLTDFLDDENPTQGWQPVGSSSSSAFKGILDGNGHSITGLWINRSNSDNVGLFGYMYHATIKNLNIEKASIKGKQYVGVISGHGNHCIIQNCILSGIVEGGSSVGGVLGISEGDEASFSNLDSEINVYGSDDKIGGIIGQNIAYNSTFNNCNVNADIEGYDYIGGIYGFSLGNGNRNILLCGFCGNIRGHSYIGGLVGYNKYTSTTLNFTSSITQSFSVNNIDASGDYVGGIIGYDEGAIKVSKVNNYNYNYYHQIYNIENTYHCGTIYTAGSFVGGIVGFKSYGQISQCYASGNVLGKKYVGGLVGSLSQATLKQSVAIFNRICATESDVHRIIGLNNGTVATMGSTEENKSYNRTIVVCNNIAQDIVDNDIEGTGVSTTTLKLKATYVAMDMDFTDTWAIQETECYPYFKRQTAPPVITSNVSSGATSISGKCIDGGLITLEIDGEKQQMTSTGNRFSFTVNPLQAGHIVRVSAKADGKEPSYYTTETVSYLGKGTEDDPYQVYTAADLTGVYRKGYFKLMNDIDLTSYINQFNPTEGWESIGRDGSETIHFDGNGHKITGLWCNSTRDNTGLFSCFANGYIKNLTVETASSKQVKGGSNTGILIGKMINGTIENCKVSGKVADGTPVGGMVGFMDDGSITHCQASVIINTTLGTTYVGGLVGEMTGGTIDHCFTAGTLNATGTESYAGGLAGKNSASVSNSYSSADVTSSYNAAGLIAYNFGMVDKCYATGDLFSNNYAAGVIGYNDGENAIVQNCAAMNKKVDVVYESQQVQQGGGYGQRIIGGIKNGAPAPEMNNYALKTMLMSVNDIPQRVYDDIMNGTAKTDEELKTKDTYETLGWDFTNVWDIDTGISYPYLRNMDNSGEIPDDPDEPIVTDENALVLDDVTVAPGSQFVLPINMINEDEITALQFDLYLPSGVTIAEEDGEMLIDLADRTTYRKHSLAFRQQADGAMRITCSSNNNATFTGNEGAVINVTLNVSNTIEEKEYIIAAKNIELSSKSGTAYAPADAKAKLSISSYVLGDADQNGKVSINDAVCIVNHILGFPNQQFLEAAADVDCNGRISINDKVVLINDYILGNSTSNAKGRAPLTEDASSGYLFIDDLNMQAGETRLIEVKMETDRTDIKALQCDITLPPGFEFVYEEEDGERYYVDKGGRADRSHTVAANIQGNGALRVVESSDNNASFKENDEAVFIFTIRAVENIAVGAYSILLSNVELSYGQIINPADRESGLNIIDDNVSTGITVANQSIWNNNVYNLNGQLIKRNNEDKKLEKGVYIVNGNKVIVK